MTEKTLKDFFKWWLSEATSKNPCRGVMANGLCSNYADWSIRKGPDNIRELDAQLNEILAEEAENNHCAKSYPFGFEEYMRRLEEETLHLDEKRLAFVRRMIEEL